MTMESDESGGAPAAEAATAVGEAVFAELWRPDATAARHGPERLLLEEGLVSSDQLDKALRRQQDNPRLSVLDALVAVKAIDAVQALQTRARYHGMGFQRVAPADVDANVLNLLPGDYVKNKLVMPICWQNDKILIGVSDPADIFLIDDVKSRIRKPVAMVVIPREDILRVMSEATADPGHHVEDIIKDIAEDAVEVVESKAEEVTDLEKIAGESPVIRYVNYLIASAVAEGASDIHVEPGENRLRIRCRVDGVLGEQHAPPAAMHAAIVSRLKIMADLNIAERRLPQDGRIRAAIRGRPVDLRVSTLPTVHGEKCVIRILDNRSITVGLESLGMNEHMLANFRKEIFKPHGIVLVTGPTGSGKSTTLYSALQVMDAETQNIATVENPVEYELPTICQVNVHESIGMTFSAALRSLLRQDPDIIMIGEIRDEETARIAVQASLTGHLGLSTLHTNDAPSSITRLINIGVEPYLISAAVNAALAQRLARRICPNCRQPETSLKESERVYLEKHEADIKQTFRGAGCDRCRHSGYTGRVGLFELLPLDDEIRDIIARDASLNELRQAAKAHGMWTLMQDGLGKIASGQTTVEEVMRITET
ncbi:MAG: GspE/PulE family protein [Planctomycetota bacterium]|nr:GspE/PulE family protein [Planctomycetota bacterium]